MPHHRVDAHTLRASDAYRLLISALVPRPIAWIGSRSPEGVDNLAPFSYFMGVGSAPPSLAVSVARLAAGGLKDTARNILQTGVFTVSIPTVGQAQQVAGSATAVGPEVSEFELVGMRPREGSRVAAPFPEAAAFAMECRLMHALDLGTTHLIVGEVLVFHVAEGLDPAALDPRALDPLARLGGADFTGLGAILTVPTPRPPGA